MRAALWQDMAQDNLQARTANKPGTQQRLLLLDTAKLRQEIRTAAANQSALILKIPLANGTNTPVELEPVNTLSATLRQRYPDIRTWKVSTPHPHLVSGRAELTPGGLHVILQGKDGEQWLTEPLAAGKKNPQYYRSYRRNASRKRHSSSFYHRLLNADAATFAQPNKITPTYAQRDANSTHTIHRFRLAIAATGEYTQQFGDSALLAFSAIVTTVNRINTIYERDLGLSLQLVSDTKTIFTAPDTDPFDETSSVSLLTQNQMVLDEHIGSEHYDLGHLLGASTHGVGIAYLASLCQEKHKAQGYSAASASALANDRFIVDYVAHELAHQLGATHTFNGTANLCGLGRFAATAFEPGSGNTIMAYAGLCANDNLQSNSLPQFHSGSIHQIQQNISRQAGSGCGTQVSRNNNTPVVHTNTAYTIPARTPFTLHGSASDLDGDVLIYSWDQLDAGNASDNNTDTANNALIKSSSLSYSGIRHVPDVTGLLKTNQSAAQGEKLPRSNREMNFRLSVRDGNGAIGSDDVKITVYDTGMDFRILTPTGSLNAGSHAIYWQVANTNEAPINCATVDIAYTNDKGATFIDLLRNTANDGGTVVELKETAQHIRVQCSNNTFFALSGTTPHVARGPNEAVPDTDTTDENNAAGDTASSVKGGGGALNMSSLLSVLAFAMLTLVRRRQLR